MNIEKLHIVKMEFNGIEIELLNEILFKILSVEKAISPNVMRMLSDEQVKLLTEIQNSIK